MNDLAWVGPALIFGLIATRFGLPPMIGYLAGGFMLNLFVDGNSTNLANIGDLGVTLLLFTIGLKLDVRSLLKPAISLGTSIHSLAIVALFGLGIFLASFTGASLFEELDFISSILIAFALSFSSTVFAIKTLEENGEMHSRHGQIAIGALVVQDIFAIVFLTFTMGKLPSLWACSLVLLLPLRRPLLKLMSSVGHGELLVLLGLALAFGSSLAFELVDVKGDLGALIMGAMVAAHPSANTMTKKLLGFKELLLVGFFLNIGMSGAITLSSALTSLALVVLLSLKVALFFWLFTKFKLRSRTAAFSSLNLASYSEFGLIVAAISLEKQWLSGDWVIVIALALSFSFIIASPLNKHARSIYKRHQAKFDLYQSPELLEEDSAITSNTTEIVVIGMASIGTCVYDMLTKEYGPVVTGIDADIDVTQNHQSQGRSVLQADATDEQFWHRLAHGNVRMLLFAMHDHETNLAVTKLSSELSAVRYAVADYDLQAADLEAAGIDKAWSLKSQAGIQFAEDIIEIESFEPTPL